MTVKTKKNGTHLDVIKIIFTEKRQLTLVFYGGKERIFEDEGFVVTDLPDYVLPSNVEL